MTNDQDTIEPKGKVDPIDSHVGRRIKMRRIMLGLSQHDLGEAVNVSIQQIQKYEKATNRVSSGKLYTLAKLLKVPVTYFYEQLSDALTEDSLAEEQHDFSTEENAGERELISLIRSFNDIRDPMVRKRVIDLVRTLALPLPSVTI